MDKIINFLRDVRVELSRVNWPTRRQTFQYTAIVIGMSFLVALFLGGWDAVFGFVLNKFLLK
ncbi:MAG: preprotein translocase subunit SecE [Patescibacteria group bacterium]